MLHLFTVHSPLTNAVARRVVEFEKLPTESARFILSRNYSLPDAQFASEKMPYSHYPVDSFPVNIAFWKNWSAMRQFDKWLSQLVDNQPFYWYADHSYSTIFYLIISHPLCKGYYFIEEGNLVYGNDSNWRVKKAANPLRGLLYRLNFGKRNNPNRHFYDIHAGNYLGCYGMIDEAFEGLPKKKNIGFPFPVRTFAEQCTCLIIHDSIYEQFESVVYLKWVAKMAEDALKRGFSNIHQKFHPAQKPETVEAIQAHIQNIIQDKANLKTLDNTASIEEIAISQKPTVYVGLSSAGIYSHIAGAKVISLFELFCQDRPELRAKFENFYPDFYSKNIEYLF